MEKRNGLYSTIALLVVVILLASFMIVNYQTPSQKEEPKTIVGTLEFPEDEGSHKEIQEFWEFYFNGSGEDGSSYSIDAIWSTYWMNVQKYNAFEIRLLKDGVFVQEENYKDFRDISTSNDNLDIKWTSDDGAAMCFERVNISADMENARYKLEFTNANSYFTINFNSISHRNVTLLGLDGKANMGMLGVVKGYLQPDLGISGKILFNNKNTTVHGTGAYIHAWGYLPPDNIGFAYVLMKEKGKTVFFFRSYLNRTDPAWELLYVIEKDKYTAFITHFSQEGNSTIGYLVDQDFVARNLTGESYDAYVSDYFPEPDNAGSHRCYPNNWVFSSSYDRWACNCWPTDRYSNDRYIWYGFMNGLDNGNRSMNGFAHIQTYYTSSVNFKNISLQREGDSADVTADIKSSLPVNTVFISYSMRVSGILNTGTENMTLSDGKWTSSIYIPESAENISVTVHVQDISYQWYSEKKEF